MHPGHSKALKELWFLSPPLCFPVALPIILYASKFVVKVVQSLAIKKKSNLQIFMDKSFIFQSG